MQYLFRIFLLLVLPMTLFFGTAKNAQVAAASEQCVANEGFNVKLQPYSYKPSHEQNHTVTGSFSGLNPNNTYSLHAYCTSLICTLPSAQTVFFNVRNAADSGVYTNQDGAVTTTLTSTGTGSFKWEITQTNALGVKPADALTKGQTTYKVELLTEPRGIKQKICEVGQYTVERGLSLACGDDARLSIWQKDARNGGNACYYPGCFQSGSPVTIKISGLKSLDTGSPQPYTGGLTLVCGQNGGVCEDQGAEVSAGEAEVSFTPNEDGEYELLFKRRNTLYDFFEGCGTTIEVDSACGDRCQDEPFSAHPRDFNKSNSPFLLCDQIGDSDMRKLCEDCATKDAADANDTAGVWTAVGCIKREPTSLIAAVVQIGLGIAGGVALLTILSAGFMLTTSQGEPKRAGEAKEMITAAVMGLLFIIFSVTILQFIGYNILQIPGFGG